MNIELQESDELKSGIIHIENLVRQKKFQEADILASQFSNKYPEEEVLLFMHADIRISLDDINSALSILEKASINSKMPSSFIGMLVNQYNNRRYHVVDKIAAIAIKAHPNEYGIFNVWGVALKQMRRFQDSEYMFMKAIKINPAEKMAFINLGNLYMESDQQKKALECFKRAVDIDPSNGEALRLKALAHIALSEEKEGVAILENALQYSDEYPSIIVDLCAFYYNTRDYYKALQLATEWCEKNKDLSLLRTKAMILRQVGRIEEAIKIFEEILSTNPDDMESIIALANAAYYGLGDAMKAKYFYDLAYSKNPNQKGLLHKMCHFLVTARNLDTSEGQNLDKAYEIAKKMIEISSSIQSSDGAQTVFLKVLDYDSYEKLGNRRAMIDYWVSKLNIPPLTMQMGRSETLEDKVYLLQAHKKWGDHIENIARKSPLVQKVRQRLNNKIRIGILSSDLRNHPVGYFTWPIIEHLDRSKFEIYCYSCYPNKPDPTQQNFMQRSDNFKIFPEDHPRNIAQSIYDDELDILFELGGSTFMSKVEVCSYKPAPVQVSWLGYPHSIGLSTTIDYIMLDPYINPEKPNLIIEKPFIMPHTWVSLDKVGFLQTPIVDTIPEDRNGYITFGSLNMAHKLNPNVFALWGYIMNMVPNSRFLYVRPETGSENLRKHFCDHMAQYGIASDRISFVATRTNHLDQYNYIDISLDVFPHTGGTTTCESLWMGVPVITLVGDAFFERLSYSNINNAGLPDLCAFTKKEYAEIALNLVNDRDRRRYLRKNLRTQITKNPLGKPALFAKGFGQVVQNIIT